ncbi:transposase [Leptothermofonsia sichuanensis]|uniref:transposase n=1 Tax=Leptothermofonsia sichuanensis TaxID=2917832 RepID=UPI0036F32F16
MTAYESSPAWSRSVLGVQPCGKQAAATDASIDSQSVKSAAMVHEAVGYDAGKHIKGCKRFMSVNTLGLVLRVLVIAASVGEREGGKQVLQRTQQMGQAMTRLHTIWVDGGFDGNPFITFIYLAMIRIMVRRLA